MHVFLKPLVFSTDVPQRNFCAFLHVCLLCKDPSHGLANCPKSGNTLTPTTTTTGSQALLVAPNRASTEKVQAAPTLRKSAVKVEQAANK